MIQTPHLDGINAEVAALKAAIPPTPADQIHAMWQAASAFIAQCAASGMHGSPMAVTLNGIFAQMSAGLPQGTDLQPLPQI